MGEGRKIEESWMVSDEDWCQQVQGYILYEQDMEEGWEEIIYWVCCMSGESCLLSGGSHPCCLAGDNVKILSPHLCNIMYTKVCSMCSMYHHYNPTYLTSNIFNTNLQYGHVGRAV